MKKMKKQKKDNHNLYILIALVLIIAGSSSYRYWLLDVNQTSFVVAKIVRVFHDPNTGRGYWMKGQPAFICEYTYEGKRYSSTQHFQEKQWDEINIGDCVELEISVRHPRTCRWNKNKGVFRCEGEE